MSDYCVDLIRWGRSVRVPPAGQFYCDYCKEERHYICHRKWCDCCHGTGKDREAHQEFLEILGSKI